MKKAALYCRVSTLNHGQSVDMQLNDLRKLAEQRGFQVVREYCDLCYFIGQEFECDEPVQACVFGFVDDTHPTATELFQDAKVRDCLAEECLGVNHFAG